MLRIPLPEDDGFALAKRARPLQLLVGHNPDPQTQPPELPVRAPFFVLVIYSAFFLTRAVFGVERLPHMRV